MQFFYPCFLVLVARDFARGHPATYLIDRDESRAYVDGRRRPPKLRSIVSRKLTLDCCWRLGNGSGLFQQCAPNAGLASFRLFIHERFNTR